MRISDWSSDVCSSDLMAGASVCVQTGSMPEVTFADVNRRYTLQMRPVIFDSVQATRQAFFSGRCDALITDASALASVRATQAGNPDDYVIFPANEIGRASCRERVCQYVNIQVGAAALKKKKK